MNLNEQVTEYKLLLVNPYYGDISHQYAKRQSDLVVLDQQVMPLICQHALITTGLGAIYIAATEVLTTGITSSYLCTNYTLNPDEGFYVHPVAISCNKLFNNNDLRILTKLVVPESWHTCLLFDFIGWYRPYGNQNMLQSLFEKPNSETYLLHQGVASIMMAASGDTTTETKLRSSAKISPKWDGNHNLTPEPGNFPSLMAIPNESGCCDDKMMCDKDVGHSHLSHCGHSYEHHWVIDCGCNETTYWQETPNPSKPYDLRARSCQ